MKKRFGEMEKGKKHLVAGRNLWQNRPQGGAAICRDRFRVRGEPKKTHCGKESEINSD